MAHHDPAPAFDLDEINRRHIRSIDKFYRMYAGAASKLLSYEDGILELDVRLDGRLKKATPAAMAVKLANSWHREPELQDATGYVAHVYKSVRPVGFVTPASGRSKKVLREEIVSRVKELAKGHPDILLETVRGGFATRP